MSPSSHSGWSTAKFSDCSSSSLLKQQSKSASLPPERSPAERLLVTRVADIENEKNVEVAAIDSALSIESSSSAYNCHITDSSSSSSSCQTSLPTNIGSSSSSSVQCLSKVSLEGGNQWQRRIPDTSTTSSTTR